MGYLAAVTFQLLTFLGVLEIFVTFLIVYVGICQFSLAFAEDIEQSLHSLDQSFAKHAKVHPKLGETIEFHAKAIQLSFWHFC